MRERFELAKGKMISYLRTAPPNFNAKVLSNSETSRWLHFGCTWKAFFDHKNAIKLISFNQIGVTACDPEKAGVGGSIPSLATTKSITYK